MRISVIGLGYVGLVTGVCLAKMGNEISFIEVNSDKVETVNKGSPPFYEEGMEAMLREPISRKGPWKGSLMDCGATEC